MPGHAARDSAGSARARTRHRTARGPAPRARTRHRTARGPAPRARTRHRTAHGPAPRARARAWRGVETDPAPARTRPRHRTQPARRCQGFPAGQCPVCSDGLALATPVRETYQRGVGDDNGRGDEFSGAWKNCLGEGVAPLWSPRCGGGTGDRPHPPAPSPSRSDREGVWIPACAGMTGTWARFIAPLHEKPTPVRDHRGDRTVPGARHTS